MRRIVGRIDFYAAAIHHAIARLACSFTTNQPIAAFVVAAAAVIDISEGINRISRTIGHACTSHAGVVFADQAVGAFIRAVAAAINGAHCDFVSAAIGLAIAFFALALVTD